jgi:hypothetical protein
MRDHWRAGYHDAVRALRHPEAPARPTSPEGVSTFDSRWTAASDGAGQLMSMERSGR